MKKVKTEKVILIILSFFISWIIWLIIGIVLGNIIWYFFYEKYVEINKEQQLIILKIKLFTSIYLSFICSFISYPIFNLIKWVRKIIIKIKRRKK